jgi:ATP-dependent DNA helicase RecG
MLDEDNTFDKKSLRLITKKNPDWDGLVKDCVGFANANGGKMIIGYEDNKDEPPAGQKIDKALTHKIQKMINGRTVNVGILLPTICSAINGGEYIELIIQPSIQTIASTSDGRYYIRISDGTKPVLPDEMSRLAADKNAFVWELQTTKRIPSKRWDETGKAEFLDGIRNSDRVSKFIKDKTDAELLEHYFLVKEGYLTNLGILWIGTRNDRAGLLYAPSIQFIKYDAAGNKINKLLWDDYSLNPYEMVEAVWKQIPDWKESFELPDGIYRKNIPRYEEIVIRELVSNALVHRNYTMRGDIFINLYPDHLEIHSPGLLPLGVTPSNILTQSIRRNDHLARIFYDLKLMEREGTGYDKIYSALLSNGKKIPRVEEYEDRVKVSVWSQVVDADSIKVMEKVNADFKLKQMELIIVGLISQHQSLLAVELSKILNIHDYQRLSEMLVSLLEQKIIIGKGKTKSKEYSLNPELIKKLNLRGKTTLKTIEKHRLRELVRQDLENYPNSSIGEIQERIGNEIPQRKIRPILNRLLGEKIIDKTGVLKHTKYFLKKI